MQCPRCEGLGYLVTMRPAVFGKLIEPPAACKPCKGTGIVPDPKPVRLGAAWSRRVSVGGRESRPAGQVSRRAFFASRQRHFQIKRVAERASPGPSEVDVMVIVDLSVLYRSLNQGNGRRRDAA
jgi:hypothetical protein